MYSRNRLWPSEARGSGRSLISAAKRLISLADGFRAASQECALRAQPQVSERAQQRVSKGFPFAEGWLLTLPQLDWYCPKHALRGVEIGDLSPRYPSRTETRKNTGRGTISSRGKGGEPRKNLRRHADAAQQVLKARVECKLLFQLRVLGLRLLEDRDIGVGVFPQREEILVGAAAWGSVTHQSIGAGKAQVG
jgi:hypothetical protein